MKRKLAWAFLALGLSCLACYIYLIFKTSAAAPIMWALSISIVLNVVAVNLFYLSGKRRRKNDD